MNSGAHTNSCQVRILPGMFINPVQDTDTIHPLNLNKGQFRVFGQYFSCPVRSLEARLNLEILKAPYPNGPLCSRSALLLGGTGGPAFRSYSPSQSMNINATRVITVATALLIMCNFLAILAIL